MPHDSQVCSRSDTGITTTSGFGDVNDVALLERKFRVWGLRRRASDPVDDARGPLGLHLLHLSAEPLVDFIFVHGLRGGSVKTWRKGTDPKQFWPQDWLPLEPAFKNVSIHTFGYNADWGDSKGSFLNVHDFGRTLLAEMKISPHIRSAGGNPIVLIGHSMGGLVIKKAYILARQDLANQDFARRIRCTFFLATPHRGSDSAPLLNNILRASGALSGKQYITDLEKNSVSTQTVNDEFRHFADELMLYSFYETTKMNFGVSSVLIVERDSAVLGYKHEQVQYLNANHRDVCKYESPLDPNYITVKNALATAIDELSRVSHVSKNKIFRAQMKVVQAYLDVYETPDDDLDVAVKGTCEWIDIREDFEEWHDAFEDTLSGKVDHNSRYYWISAKPANGKSVLAGHVITHLQQLGLDCSYYYFHYGNKSRQKLNGLLRSLAYQMAVSNAVVRQKLLELVDDGVQFDKDDERAIWRKLFANGILKAEICRPQYWVIDALDECINFPVLFPFLTKLQSAFPLRIFITSRIQPDIEKQFARLGHDVVAAEISPQDISRDIELYLQSRIDDLPVDSNAERQELAKKILSKSGGCFLWVRLVLQVLEHIYDETTIETVLEEIPEEMTEFYDRTVELMSKNLREKDIAKAILRWSVVCTRPLKTAEFEQALNLDIGANVRSIEKSIEGLCGQLVFVDKSKSVQMVHQTARDYLFRNQHSEFWIDLGAEHERAAIACLKFLCSDEMKPPRNPRQLSTRAAERSVLCDYACTSFSEHVFAAHSEKDDILVSLDRFLRTNVLTWIEHILRKGSLYYLTRTAKNLKGYLERRAKYLSPLGTQVRMVEEWATDLIRLVAKFGATMLSDPTSIYFLIPPLCPTDSAIYKCSAKPPDGLVLTGVTNTSWEDCISCIDFHTSRATALACGENVFAIGMRSGSITLYNQTTFQAEQTFQHLEPVKVLKFDNCCRRFASAGWKTIKLWDRTGSQIWSQCLASPCIAVAFDAKHVVGVSKASHVTFWDVVDGAVKSDHFYGYQEPDYVESNAPQRAPLAAAFSHNLEILALGYRSQYVCLWDLSNQDFIGCCSRPAEDGSETVGLCVGTVHFNSNPDMNLLAIGYQDGDLAIFEPWSRELLTVVEANALSLASSPDGRTLAAGDSCGTVQIWDFETLTLLYRIKSFDFEVKDVAFSGDGLRLVDIRDSRSKVWEPAVLVRKTVEEDVSVSDAAATPAITVGLGYLNEILNITALAAHPNLPVIFAGKSNGCVAVYDSLTGKETALVYSHPKDVFITIIASCKNNIVASADAGGTVQVWELERSTKGCWSTRSQILATSLKQSIKQLLFSQEGQYLLISAASSAAVWSTRTGDLVGTSEFAPSERTVWKWLSTPGPESELLLITNNKIERHRWSAFPTAIKLPCFRFSYDESLKSDEIEIQNAFLEAKSQHLIVDFRKHYGNKATAKLLVFDYSSSPTSSNGLHPNANYSRLGEKVKYFIGVIKSRLAFIDRDSWLSSVDLVSYSGKEYTRHFYVPHEVVNGNTGVLSVLTAAGDIAFARGGEVAVVRNGMKFHVVIEIT
ncbi:hypothetical protein N431DRAFT_489271 [Stipitochalara longipes BDJ]|nr:hypothetical protein N431DRAFT_489271 [Stipitochalara longipes BDJ]